MAAATTPFVSIEEYLRTRYEPGADDVDGILQLEGTPIQLDLAALSRAMQKKKR
jgi:hypothetical protein